MIDPTIDQAPIFLSDDIRKINSATEHTVSTSSSASTLSSTSMSVSTRLSFDSESIDETTRWRPGFHHKNGDLKRKCPQYPARKQYLALDCEMVGVGRNATRSSLARVVIVNWRRQVLFDEHIIQSEPVTDYRTFVSGITEETLLQRARIPLDVCRARVAQILHNKVLVGHGLENDLNVLGINHPWWLVRDTACYQPFMHQRFEMWMPRKLKDLVFELLGKEIQEAGKPHDPCEDAVWAMNLYKIVRSDWESSVDYMMKRSVIESSIQRLHERVGQPQNYWEEIH
jgi:RNA exonuclease 4